MDRWENLRRKAEGYREEYPPGTRILLEHMGADPCRVEGGTRGTVLAVDDAGTLHCGFDNGRSLGVVPGEDVFRKLTEAELLEEQAERQAEAGPGEGMGQEDAMAIGM